MQDILVYLDRHSQENINIEALAHKYNMSYSYFAKLFLKHYGQSCKQYIEFIRLNKVENLLLFTDYDLNYIAAETGFADCSHLIRTFKSGTRSPRGNSVKSTRPRFPRLSRRSWDNLKMKKPCKKERCHKKT